MIVDVAKQSSLAKSSIAAGENLHAILRLNLSKFGYVEFPRRCGGAICLQPRMHGKYIFSIYHLL
jgi:hypothetical protein